MKSAVTAAALALQIVVAAVPASAQLVATGKTLTVTTTNAVATFNGPDLVGFLNVLTGERYLKNPSDGNLAQMYTIPYNPQVLQASNWTIGTEAGTGAALATIAAQDATRTLVLTVKIDTATQEIVVRPSASVTTPGLRGASWTMAGLDLTGGRWIVPAMTGMVFDSAHPGIGANLDYPNFWHAQMAVYQGGSGSFTLYSTDTQAYSKHLTHATRGDGTIDVGIQTDAIAPFPSASAIPTVEWRFKAFVGDWRVAAEPYRTWLAANRPPVSNAAHPWVSNIRTVVGVNTLDTSILTQLAATLVPSQTLLYMIDWRLAPYDVNYPDYTPRAGTAAFVTAAHALGFKVMLHLDFIGVSPGNPDYAAMLPYQVKDPDTLALTGWEWDWPASTATRFAFISPAASAFRTLFIARVGAAVSAVSPDALHLDISAPMTNDGNGLIEGRTYAQGAAQLHQDLIANFPTIALAGEGENDILARYQSFAQAWFFPQTWTAPGHPIATYLFSPQVQYYGHLGQPSARDPSFKSYLVDLQRRAILPRFALGGTEDLDLTNADNARLIGMLQSWQSHAFQPAWSADWSGAVVRYQGLAASTADLSDSGTILTLTAAGTPLFRLAHDANQLPTAAFIASWPAFDSNSLYGLDPGKLYFLNSAARPATTHVSSLPAGIRLGAGTLIGNGFAHVEVQPTQAGSFDFENNLPTAHMGIRFQGVDTPLAFGAVVQRQSNTALGITLPDIFIHPPFLGDVGGETFVEYAVPVPVGAAMRFSVSVDDGASCTDGVTFRVTANGFELWHQDIGRTGWHDIVLDLAAYGGTTTAIRLISNPGAANNPSCDWAGWARLSISSPTGTTAVPLALGAGSTNAGFDGDGTVTFPSPQSANVASVPATGGFTLFTQTGTAVGNGTNLTSLPFQLWSASHDEVAAPGSVFNDGVVGSAVSGGVTKNPTIFAHPPDGGTTTLSWVLKLPDATALRLGFSVGLGDGSASADGVEFQVRINGLTYWRFTTKTTGWTPGVIDLTRWKGQNTLVELVTDSEAHYIFDWAYWGDLVLTSSAGSCSYAVSGPASVPAFGGTFNVSVATAAGCPWSATSSAPWLTPVTVAGSGNGSVDYAVAPNTGTTRNATLTIGGQPFVVSQAASTIVTNALPTLSSIAGVSVRRNTQRAVAFTVGDPIGGAGGVTVSATSSNQALIPNAGLVAGGAGAARTLTLVPLANQIGSATITVTVTARGLSVSTSFAVVVYPISPAGDYGGDGRSEIAVYRPSNGAWYALQSGSSFTVATGVLWGTAGDIPVPGDYDGDGITDIAVFRPSSGVWYVIRSSTGVPFAVPWGASTDVPVPGDYDGDGKTDVAVFRPSNGAWYIVRSSTGVAVGMFWGASIDVPVPADYDGDGITDIAVFRPSIGTWFVVRSGTGVAATMNWGASTDVPVPGDYDGDGKADITVFRPSNGTWYILPSASGIATGIPWGGNGDVPVHGDFDGDGKADIAVFRPSTGTWYVVPSRTGAAFGIQWGTAGDVPIVK